MLNIDFRHQLSVNNVHASMDLEQRLIYSDEPLSNIIRSAYLHPSSDCCST